jgi:protein tyrosine phosphatase (PTP) superfamily phosphohydrolase (DUF442 family)
MSVAAIKYFIAIDERVGTAGQPTEDELRAVAATGYSAVINLGLLDPKYCLPDEAGLVASLGLTYRHIPVVWTAPAVSDFEAFVAAMDALATERVFVHCAANYRVSSFMALYGELRLGWTRARADAHARTLWEPNEIWLGLLAACRTKLLPAP